MTTSQAGTLADLAQEAAARECPEATPEALSILNDVVYLAAVGEVRTVERAARWLGVCTRTLARRMEVSGLPAPGAVIALGRLLAATTVLSGGATVDTAARAVGWTAQPNLSGAMIHHCGGLWPSALRGRPLDEALAVVLNRFPWQRRTA